MLELPGDLSPALFAASVARLERLTAVSSPSDDRAGLWRVAEQIAIELEHHGWQSRILEPSDVGSESLPLLEARAPELTSSPLLLLGHLDTVLTAPAPRREADRLFATGAIDMKGGIATLLAALDLLAARGLSPTDALFVLVPDEEVAGPVSRSVTAEYGASASACWVLEPGELRPDGSETIVCGRRGLVNFRLAARGRSSHSGLAYHAGRSAVAAACAWGARAAALSQTGPGPTINLARIVGGERQFVEELALRAELVGSDRQLNVVPDRALVEGEFRFLSRSDGARVERELRELAESVAKQTGVELGLRFGEPIAPVDPTPERIATAQRAVDAAKARGWSLEVEVDRGGISFPNFLPAERALPVLDGLGPAGGGMHTREEFIDLRSFARRIVLLADLLEVRERSGRS